MRFHELSQNVMSRDKGVKNSAAQINEIISLTLGEMKRHIKKHPIKGTYDVIRLIYRANG